MSADDLGRQAYQKLMLNEYREAVVILNKAIIKYPDDYKLYINRCYSQIQLKEYSNAMMDAYHLIKNFPEIPNGYFLRGELYLLMHRYEEAEKDFQALFDMDTDEDLSEVDEKLFDCRMQQILKKGYEIDVARKALRLAASAEEAIAILASGLIKNGEGEKELTFQLTEEEERWFEKEFEKIEENDSWIKNSNAKPKVPKKLVAAKEELDPLMDPSNPHASSSLWIGCKDPRNNICKDLTKPIEKEFINLFSQYGSLKNFIPNFERRCIFVNYFTPDAASKAMRELQNYQFRNNALLIKFSSSSTGIYSKKKLVDLRTLSL